MFLSFTCNKIFTDEYHNMYIKCTTSEVMITANFELVSAKHDKKILLLKLSIYVRKYLLTSNTYMYNRYIY